MSRENRQSMVDMIDSNNALLAWFKSQDIKPFDGIETMSFLIGSTVANNYHDRDQMIEQVRKITHYIRLVALTSFDEKNKQKEQS